MPRQSKSKKTSDAADTSGGGLIVAKALFGDVMQGSVNTSVDPRACLPLTRIRDLSRSGVMRLKRIFRGRTRDLGSECNIGESIGFVAGTDTPILIRLEGTYGRYVTDYFKSDKELSEREAREQARSRDTWYGVIDGMHRLRAIQELIQEEPEKWNGFQWPATILKGGFPLQVLKQLARHQNSKYSQHQYVETTLFDQLKGLKQEANRLFLENGKKPSGRDIADAYDGCGEYADRTMKQMANTALRLEDEVISVIGNIMNSDHPDLVKLEARESKESYSDEDLLSTVDCRVYRRFLSITSLKQATVFMKAEGRRGIEAQINTLHRCKEICRANGFRAISYKVVSEQFKMAVLAQKECEKFEALMETGIWPEDMETMRHNMLKSTKLDAELSSNAGNDANVLPSLISKYKAVCPAISAGKLKKYSAALLENDSHVNSGSTRSERSNSVTKRTCKATTLKSSSEGEDSAPVLQNETDRTLEFPATNELTILSPPMYAERIPTGMSNRNPGRVDMEENVAIDDNASDFVQSQLRSQRGAAGATSTAASERLESKGLDLLDSMNITSYQMKWQDFDKTILRDDTPLFDLVLTDPPYGVPENPARAGTKYKDYVDDEEMKELAQFTRRALVPGGYVFLFTSARYFYSWVQAFRETGMKPCQYPFVVHKNTRNLQGTRLEDFPQNASEFAVMVRAPGKASSEFKPDFTSPFQLFPCDQKRRYASVLNSPIPLKKLTNGVTRSPILVEEKSPETLAEIMITFCPEGGSVLDCYAGTCTTAIASIRTRRRCVCIEKDPDTYRLALSRLKDIAAAEQQAGFPSAKRLCTVSKSVGDHALIQQPETRKSTSTRGLQVAGREGNANSLVTESSGGCEVLLQLDGEHVGFATLQSGDGKENGPLQRRIHGTHLERAGEEGPDLVVILQVLILPPFKTHGYPYVFPTQDDVPQTLGDLDRNGVYVWDKSNMHLKPYSDEGMLVKT